MTDMTQEEIRALPHKVVNGLAVLLTADEIAAREAEEAAWTPPVPQTVTRTQGLLALLTVGITEAAIAERLAMIPDEIERERARIRFNGPVWERDSDLLAAMAAAFDLTGERVDGLFILARTL